MTLDDVFGLQPLPSVAQPRRVERLGPWPQLRTFGPKSDRARTTKLTRDQVSAIRRELAEGADSYALAARYGVHYSSIRNCATGRTWRDE